MRLQAESLFQALARSGRFFIVILPNNDPGSEDILAAIDELPSEQFRILPSMRANYFSELMKNAKVFVGNSSAGVREAPFLGVPSLDVGTRQSSRSSAGSITPSSPIDAAKIIGFLENNWGKRFPADQGFGQGSASERFLELIQDDNFWACSFQKNFCEDYENG
jgi:UDP-N-acetylglucosamine 2-epimerase (hydrolysing)